MRRRSLLIAVVDVAANKRVWRAVAIAVGGGVETAGNETLETGVGRWFESSTTTVWKLTGDGFTSEVVPLELFAFVYKSLIRGRNASDCLYACAESSPRRERGPGLPECTSQLGGWTQ